MNWEEALTGPDPDHRKEAAYHLGQAASVDVLAAALTDPRLDVRLNAAEALGMCGVEAIPALTRATHDDAAPVRQTAARALGQVGSPQAAEVLIALLADPESKVLRAAVRSLASVGTDPAPLLPLLEHPTPVIRQTVAEALGAYPGTLTALVNALADSNWTVRLAAAKSLGQQADPAALPALRSANEVETKRHVQIAIQQAMAQIETDTPDQNP